MITFEEEKFDPIPGMPIALSAQRFEPNYPAMNCAFTQFIAIVIIAVSMTIYFAKQKHFLDRLTFGWFAFDAMIHTFMEGSFVYASLENRFNGGVSTSALPRPVTCVWTEYGKADYRWLYGDPNIVGLEIVTVFIEAPLCWLILFGILKHSNWRHVVQLVICLGEVYGLYETFVPEWIYGSPNLDGSSFLYFWIYLGSNLPWLVIPLLLIAQSAYEISMAFKVKNYYENSNSTPRIRAKMNS
jgi:hypothetical protein